MKDTKSVNTVSVQVSVADRHGTDIAQTETLQAVSLSELRNKCQTENISCKELASLLNSMMKARQQHQKISENQ